MPSNRKSPKSLVLACHLLRNVAPSNLNRNESGQPKTVIIGGLQHAIISSQCQKRAVRDRSRVTLPAAYTTIQTQYLVLWLAARLREVRDLSVEDAEWVALCAVLAIGCKVSFHGDGRPARTDLVIQTTPQEVEALIEVCLQHLEALLGMERRAKPWVSEDLGDIVVDLNAVGEGEADEAVLDDFVDQVEDVADDASKPKKKDEGEEEDRRHTSQANGDVREGCTY